MTPAGDRAVFNLSSSPFMLRPRPCKAEAPTLGPCMDYIMAPDVSLADCGPTDGNSGGLSVAVSVASMSCNS